MTTEHENDAAISARLRLLEQAEQAQAAGHSRTAEQLRRDAEVVRGDEGLDAAGEGAGAAELDRGAHAERTRQQPDAIDVTRGQRPMG